MSHPLDDLLRLAEQSYIRMEAEQLITACIHDGDLTPFNDLLQELVLAGPSSLFVLRDLLRIIHTLRSKLGQEGLSVRQDLKQALLDFGVHVPQVLLESEPESWWHLCHQDLPKKVRSVANKLELDGAALAEEICIEAGKKVSRLARQLVLVNELESAVQDWIAGLLYEHAHQSTSAFPGEKYLPEH